MQSNENRLLIAYRRRGFQTRGLLTVLAAGMALAPLTSTGQNQNPQDPPKTVVQTGGSRTDTNAKPGTTTTVVPQRRTFTPDGKVTSTAKSTETSSFPTGGTPFTFDFHGANISNVLQFFAKVSGQTITADSRVSGQVTIINPKPVSLDEAFKILQAVLASRGFTAQTNGSVISIVPFGDSVRSTTQFNSGPEGRQDSRNQVMTQIIPLDNVQADSLARDLQPLISNGASLIGSNTSNALILTDTADNVKRFLSIVESLDKSSANNEMVTYTLRRAEAVNVAAVINNIYSQTAPRSAPSNQENGVDRNDIVSGQNGGRSGAGQQFGPAPRPAVVAIPETRTNSVIVIASRDKQTEISKKVIAMLDDNDTNTLDTKYIKIKYADATVLSGLVNNVLSNMHGTSAANGKPSAATFNPYGFGGANGPSTDPFGQVVADPRTNGVLVTASAEKMATIEGLIKQMDVAVENQPTTVVMALQRAKANDVAAALSSAFGTPANFSNNSIAAPRNAPGSQTNGNGSTHTATNRNYTSTSAQSASQGSAPAPPPGPQTGATDTGSAIPDGVQGVMTSSGQFVPTSNGNQTSSTRAVQFGGAGGQNRGGATGGQNRAGTSSSNSSGTLQTGTGSNGSVVNLQQLQGQVYVTPTPNGDGIIVTAPPAYMETVRGIVEQLDVIPRQVMIEVVVAEVTLDTDQNLGFSAAGMLSRLFRSNTTGQLQSNQPVTSFNPATATGLDAAANGFQFVLNNANYSAVLQVLNDSTNVSILGTPKVFTSNNQIATIDIQQFVPYITGQAASGLTTTVANQVQYLQVGFSLIVTPRITRTGQVTMDITQETSELLNYQTLGTGAGAISAPVTNDRYTDTEVTVQDNETIVIGGLIHSTDNVTRVKIPLLGDIPLLGQLFQSKQHSHEKQELVIFVTPHVVNNPEEARKLTEKEGKSIVQRIPEIAKEQPNLDYFKKKPAATTVPTKSATAPVVPPTPDPTSTTGTTTPPNTQNPNIIKP